MPHATRILTAADVRRFLTMPRCIELMEQTLRALDGGQNIALPLRPIVRIPGQPGILGLMPGAIRIDDSQPMATGLKAISVFHDNAAKGLESHQGVVLLFDAEDGRLRAILEAASMTEIRTAAASAVATRALALPEARTLAILGSGVQGRAHIESIRHVRNIDSVRIWSRNQDNAEKLAGQIAMTHDLAVRACETVREATRDAQIICTVTAAHDAILTAEDVAPGCHINAVGACTARMRELDTALMQRARVFTDRMESALNEAGDLLLPMGEGALSESHLLGEIGAVLTGRIEGRASDDDITIFESLGIAVEDLTSAQMIVELAEAEGAGRMIDLENG